MAEAGAPDALIIGGGIMGCSAAYALAKKGRSAWVLERSVPGAEASSAAAGILGAQIEAHHDGPMAEFCFASRSLYPSWVDGLRKETGIDVGYRSCGAMRVAFDDAELERICREMAWQSKRGLPLQIVDRMSLRALEPAVAPRAIGGVRVPEDARVDPPFLVRALRIAAERAGAKFRVGAVVAKVAVVEGRAVGVVLADGTKIGAKNVVVAAGSWSGLVEGSGVSGEDVRPARGQIVELVCSTPPIASVLFGPGCYLSPRDDGRVLVGSTLEFVGFRTGVTASAVRDLLAHAIDLVPALGEASVNRSWSSFRPFTTDEMPLLGPTKIRNLLLSTGHYRNGILLAPLSGELIARAVMGEPLAELGAFSPNRTIANGLHD